MLTFSDQEETILGFEREIGKKVVLLLLEYACTADTTQAPSLPRHHASAEYHAPAKLHRYPTRSERQRWKLAAKASSVASISDVAEVTMLMGSFPRLQAVAAACRPRPHGFDIRRLSHWRSRPEHGTKMDDKQYHASEGGGGWTGSTGCSWVHRATGLDTRRIVVGVAQG
jgi:hypothetical protein